ncbi:MAG: hypothetical protein F6K37_30615 [Moorea sp. SIO4E2]|uniref:hypothetical protein n=1 Tax=Moorena sp. SIO4E2 TaxID=2607826 RepID=UPI0013B746FC|nr:hypothetical protein [Moorena sp. SIO4E2]NEQ10130.1 hypothetical protein [Moorena sp. SIO4E2]
MQADKEVLTEYYHLVSKSELTEIESKRLDKILEMAESDDTVSFLINEIDELTFQELDFITNEPVNCSNIVILDEWVKENYGDDWQPREPVFGNPKLNSEPSYIAAGFSGSTESRIKRVREVNLGEAGKIELIISFTTEEEENDILVTLKPIIHDCLPSNLELTLIFDGEIIRSKTKEGNKSKKLSNRIFLFRGSVLRIQICFDQIKFTQNVIV